MRRLVLLGGLIATLLSGCTNHDVEKVKKLERDNRLLAQFKADVEKLDGATTYSGILEGEQNIHCQKSENLMLRTNLGCAWSNYIGGIQIQDEANVKNSDGQKELTDHELARWGLVMELNNRYADGTEYGETRFRAVRAAVLDREFTKRVTPADAMKLIRNYMYMSQKDFGDLLLRTAAGEKTSLTSGNAAKTEEKPKEGGKTEGAKQNEPLAKANASAQSKPAPGAKKKWTYEQAMKEACDAGRQYREDVDLHGMKPSQAEYEAKAYSQYLSENSSAPRKALYDKIQQGLWMDSCF